MAQNKKGACVCQTISKAGFEHKSLTPKSKKTVTQLQYAKYTTLTCLLLIFKISKLAFWFHLNRQQTQSSHTVSPPHHVTNKQQPDAPENFYYIFLMLS